MEEEGLLMSSSSRTASAAIGLAGAGLLLAAGGLLHPRVDTSAEFEQGLAGMFERSAWVASHAITLAGFVLLAVSLAGLLRGLGPAWDARRRLIGWTVVAGAGIAAVESVPHLLAASEADALMDGARTPLTDLHSILQAIATPVLGLSVAALAVTCAPSRALGSGRIAAAVAVGGGVAFALAGPLIAITHNSELSPLFVGSAGIAIWLMVSGIGTARRLAGVRIDPELGTAAAR
jgi:hypothetical protein